MQTKFCLRFLIKLASNHFWEFVHARAPKKAVDSLPEFHSELLDILRRSNSTDLDFEDSSLQVLHELYRKKLAKIYKKAGLPYRMAWYTTFQRNFKAESKRSRHYMMSSALVWIGRFLYMTSPEKREEIKTRKGYGEHYHSNYDQIIREMVTY